MSEEQQSAEERLRLAGKMRKPDVVFAQEGPDKTAPQPDPKEIRELDAEAEVERRPPKQDQSGPQLIRLDQATMLQIELLATKKKLAEANEKIAMIALQDAKKARKELEQEEAVLLERVRSQVGARSGNVRLVDRQKGICQVG